MRCNDRNLVATIGGTAKPPGGFVLVWPFDAEPAEVRINGRLVRWPKNGLRIPATGRPIIIEAVRPVNENSKHRPTNKDK